MTSELTREWLQHQISGIEVAGITNSNTLAAFKLALATMDAWNACSITTLSSAGAAENRRSNENTQVVQMQSGTTHTSEPVQSGSELAAAPVNNAAAGKPLTITLPDISSKAFWSGSGKAEVFHPETYRRWVKEAIERHCAIFGIGVRVK